MVVVTSGMAPRLIIVMARTIGSGIVIIAMRIVTIVGITIVAMAIAVAVAMAAATVVD